MNRTVVAIVAVLLLVVAGCSSSDPTASDEYQALEQELAQTEAELAEITTERNALAEEAAAAVGPEETDAVVAPDELAALIDDWEAALNRGDDSVLDLYVPEGYHLYGDKRSEYNELAAHLSAGGIEHDWLTEPLLITEDEDGRYVVVRGMRITMPGVWTNASAFLFEIVTMPDGELRIVQTALFYDTEWSAG